MKPDEQRIINKKVVRPQQLAKATFDDKLMCVSTYLPSQLSVEYQSTLLHNNNSYNASPNPKAPLLQTATSKRLAPRNSAFMMRLKANQYSQRERHSCQAVLEGNRLVNRINNTNNNPNSQSSASGNANKSRATPQGQKIEETLYFSVQPPKSAKGRPTNTLPATSKASSSLLSSSLMKQQITKYSKTSSIGHTAFGKPASVAHHPYYSERPHQPQRISGIHNKQDQRHYGSLVSDMNRYFERFGTNHEFKLINRNDSNNGKIQLVVSSGSKLQMQSGTGIHSFQDDCAFFDLRVLGERHKCMDVTSKKDITALQSKNSLVSSRNTMQQSTKEKDKEISKEFVPHQSTEGGEPKEQNQAARNSQSPKRLSNREAMSASASNRSPVNTRRRMNSTKPVQYDPALLFGPLENNQIFRNEDPNIIKLLYYRDFVWKVGYSNNFIVKSTNAPEKKLKYYVGKGNNSKLVRTILARRWWWIRQKDEKEADFAWTQLKLCDVYKKQQPASKVRQHDTPSNPMLLAKLKKDPAQLIFNTSRFEKWSSYLAENHAKQKKAAIKEEGAFENRRRMLCKNMQFVQEPAGMVTNHLQFSRYLGNKKALFQTMKQYYSVSGEDFRDYLPLTYHITQGLEDEQYVSFLASFCERRKNKSGGPNIWILKPGEMSNRGNGITVCDSLDQIKGILKKRERHDNGKVKSYIVQEYLAAPFLYKNRKFDIRHYMMMTSINGVIKGYFYQQGYIRTTSYEYNLNQLGGFVHLTNDAVQKYSKDYGKYERGNKLSYADFQTYLDSKYGQGTHNFQEVLIQMQKIATDAIRAAYISIDPQRRLHNFEVFGMDFMIDSDFKPWLIEINTNPCLELSCPLLGRLIPAMVENAFRIGLDPIYPPPPGPTNKKVVFQENRFKLVFDQLEQGPELDRIYSGQKNIGELLGEVGSDDQAYEDEEQDDD